MSFKLTILGNNAAIPAHSRHQTAQLLVFQEQHILIDCGESTQLQLKRYNIKPGKIRHILISHLHGDHYFGLIGLLSSMHLHGRKTKLNLYGPPELLNIINLQLKASDTRLIFELNFIPLVPQMHKVIYEHENFTITTFPLDHTIACHGFLFKEKPKKRKIIKENLPDNIRLQDILTIKNGQNVVDQQGHIIYHFNNYSLPPRRSLSYAYCSDTRYNDGVIQYIQSADLLYHESTFANDMADRAAMTFHSTAEEAARIAQKAGVGKLILGHYSTRYKDLSILLEESRALFEESYLSQEGETIEISDQR